VKLKVMSLLTCTALLVPIGMIAHADVRIGIGVGFVPPVYVPPPVYYPPPPPYYSPPPPVYYGPGVIYGDPDWEYGGEGWRDQRWHGEHWDHDHGHDRDRGDRHHER
jgi:hypothetical protein